MSKTAMVRYVWDKLKESDDSIDKKLILERYSSDSLFRRIIYLAHHPMITFGYNDLKDKIKESSGVSGGMGISKFLHIIEDMNMGRFTQEEFVFAINLALTHINEQELPLFLGILKKDLDCGLTIDLINSVYPDLIPEYPIQNPVEFTENLDIEWPAVIQPVVKGERVNIIIRNSCVEFRDKNGKILDIYQKYSDQFLTLSQGSGVVFDGSFINGKFILWDVIKYDGFCKGLDNRIGYNWRFNGLEHMIMLSADKIEQPCFSIPPHMIVSSLEEAKSGRDQIKTDIIIKSMSSIWKSGENESLVLLRMD